MKMMVNNRSEIGKISNADALEGNTDANQYRFYAFRNRSYIDQKREMSLGENSNTVYRISFTIINDPFHLSNTASISNYSLLSFSTALQESTNPENVERYETYFSADFLNKKAIELSENLKLFNSQLPMTFLIRQNQEWRIKEVFESMLNESLKAGEYKNEMMQILIYQLILFSQRLTPADS